MKFVNLTPHRVGLKVGEEINIVESTGLARVDTLEGSEERRVNGVPIFSTTRFGSVTGLPAPDGESIFIVSRLVAERCAGRTDVVFPGTGPKDHPIRDPAGRIMAVTRLISAPPAKD